MLTFFMMSLKVASIIAILKVSVYLFYEFQISLDISYQFHPFDKLNILSLRNEIIVNLNF